MKGIHAVNEHDHTDKDEPATKPAHDEVAKKAYAIYLKEGRPQAHAEQNWLKSEAQLQPVGSDHTAQQLEGNAWHSQSAEDVLGQVGSEATGLSAAEAARRVAADGPNELKEGHPSACSTCFPLSSKASASGFSSPRLSSPACWANGSMPSPSSPSSS